VDTKPSPDCGFTTFAGNPLASERIAEAKLASLVKASERLKERHGIV
jgi:hypothetical protein